MFLSVSVRKGFVSVDSEFCFVGGSEPAESFKI